MNKFSFNFQLSIFNSQLPLVPLYIALRLASLLILQILQDARIGTDGDIVILPPSERRKAGGEIETVEVARDGARSLRNLFHLEVVARVERERPVV